MKLFADIKVGRKYYDDKNTYHCTNCKGNYDAKILGTDKCPDCAKSKIITTMHFRKQYIQLWTDAFGKPLN